MPRVCYTGVQSVVESPQAIDPRNHNTGMQAPKKTLTSTAINETSEILMASPEPLSYVSQRDRCLVHDRHYEQV